MKRYLLDTTPMTALLGGHPAVASLVAPWMRDHSIATSALVYAEVVEGLKGRANFDERHRELHVLLGEISPYFLTFPILERYADLRRQMRRPHGSGLIGDIDSLIAATALDRGVTVVTADSDFLRVPGLDILLLDRRTLSPMASMDIPE
ncbi:MAG: type II toxin-antitoxin system VapC family toxin [Thermomicrobiales bacterium]